MIQTVVNNVPPGSLLGFAVQQGGQAIVARTTAGITPGTTGTGVFDGGLAGGTYSALVDESLGPDAVTWDTGGSNPQYVVCSLITATVSDPAPAGIDPSTAAMLLTQGGASAGPYPASLSNNADGTQNLNLAFCVLPPGFTMGNLLAQPGTLIDGVFNPVGPPITDSSMTAAGSGATVLPDFALSAGPVQTDISDLNSCYLLAGSDGDIHVKIGGTYNADGTPVDIAGMITAGNALSIALVNGFSSPAPAYQPADLLTVTTPSASAGTYAHLSLSSALGNLPPPGAYYAAVQLGGAEKQAQDIFIVR